MKDDLIQLSFNGQLSREQLTRMISELEKNSIGWVVLNPRFQSGPVMTNSKGNVCPIPVTWMVNFYMRIG